MERESTEKLSDLLLATLHGRGGHRENSEKSSRPDFSAPLFTQAWLRKGELSAQGIRTPEKGKMQDITIRGQCLVIRGNGGGQILGIPGLGVVLSPKSCVVLGRLLNLTECEGLV